MGTTEKVRALKEAIATAFIETTTRNETTGIQYKYKSFPIYLERAVDDLVGVQPEVKGWCFQIIVKEPAYPERILQEFKYERPNNIDVKSMEWHVLVNILSELINTSGFVWNQLGTILNTDTDMQKTAIDSLKQD